MENKEINMLKKLSIILLFMQFCTLAHANNNALLTIEFTVPDLQVEPYHRPYVAVWLETVDRQGVHTFLFWHEQEDWFKDLRQWWRKIGRKQSPAYDAVTSATKKPGVYKITWNGILADNTHVLAGDYILHFEAVREQGSREYLRQKITLNAKKNQSFTLQGKNEIGIINIKVK